MSIQPNNPPNDQPTPGEAPVQFTSKAAFVPSVPRIEGPAGPYRSPSPYDAISSRNKQPDIRDQLIDAKLHDVIGYPKPALDLPIIREAVQHKRAGEQ